MSILEKAFAGLDALLSKIKVAGENQETDEQDNGKNAKGDGNKDPEKGVED